MRRAGVTTRASQPCPVPDPAPHPSAGEVDERIADQDAAEAGRHHHPEAGDPLVDEEPAQDERDVLRERHAQPAGHQHGEDGQVGHRPMGTEQEGLEDCFQAGSGRGPRSRKTLPPPVAAAQVDGGSRTGEQGLERFPVGLEPGTELGHDGHQELEAGLRLLSAAAGSRSSAPPPRSPASTPPRCTSAAPAGAAPAHRASPRA